MFTLQETRLICILLLLHKGAFSISRNRECIISLFGGLIGLCYFATNTQTHTHTTWQSNKKLFVLFIYFIPKQMANKNYIPISLLLPGNKNHLVFMCYLCARLCVCVCLHMFYIPSYTNYFHFMFSLDFYSLHERKNFQSFTLLYSLSLCAFEHLFNVLFSFYILLPLHTGRRAS